MIEEYCKKCDHPFGKYYEGTTCPTEFGSNNKNFKDLGDNTAILKYSNSSENLNGLLEKSIDSLELTIWQKESLKKLSQQALSKG